LTSGRSSDGVHFSKLKETDIAQGQLRIELANLSIFADCQLPRRRIPALAPALLMRHSLWWVDLECRDLAHRVNICGEVKNHASIE
jgi:hypothetical protein